jgi:hypothetical protein
MVVGIEGYGDRRVAKQQLDDLQMHALTEQQRRAGITE